MKKWKENDIKLLNKLLKDGYSYIEIGERLNRTRRSIQSKCFKLGISIWKIQEGKNSKHIICLECGNEFQDYINNNRKFCSRSCSITHNNKKRELDYTKTKESICINCDETIVINIRASEKNCRCEKCNKENRKKYWINRNPQKRSPQKKKVRKNKTKNVRGKIDRYCKKCGGNIITSKKQYCEECKYNYYHIYRPRCNFSFSLDSYPNDFDFDLIKKHGWYSPTNKNNNLSGVSRDHILSVREGFENNIDPKIISHPANCRLMIHNENNTKNTKSDITIKELEQKIEKWNSRGTFNMTLSHYSE